MRTFLAVDIPNDVRQQIIVQTAQLRKDYGNFEWVPSENFHITLFYIGEVPEAKLDVLNEHIEKAIYDITPTHIFSLGAKLFIHKSITAYLTFRKNPTLELLNKRFVELFEDKKKEYKPHITIARWKIPSKQQYYHLKKKLENLKVDLEFPVKEIHLFESITEQKIAVYRKIHTFKLEE